VDVRRAQLRERGATFYIGLPLTLWFGIYRLYPSKDFMNFLVFNYSLELFLQALPLTLITLSTNAYAVGFEETRGLMLGTLGLLIVNMLEILI
jgi:hypothetical protein